MDTYTVKKNGFVWLAPKTQSCDGRVRWAEMGCSVWELSLHQTALLKCFPPHLWDYGCKSDQKSQKKERNIDQVARWHIPAVRMILTTCCLYMRSKGTLRIVMQHSSSANPNSASTVSGISKDTKSGMTSKLWQLHATRSQRWLGTSEATQKQNMVSCYCCPPFCSEYRCLNKDTLEPVN